MANSAIVLLTTTPWTTTTTSDPCESPPTSLTDFLDRKWSPTEYLGQSYRLGNITITPHT
ncbi:hypothetical protein [Levilactobacillus yonginensis]|uniref:hypothetical protein n=1 Tax=Levilactobacillus yonginensis TaxID=1054041 RepID=UPI00345C9F01